jgi:hypothetical protein
MRVSVLSALTLSVLAVTAVPSASASGSGSAPGEELHAPRIPGPMPSTRPGASVAIREWTSTNWSGYALNGTGLTQVTGTWHVPTVQPPTTKRRYRKNTFSSSWVGIDGYNNSDLIQAGTEQDWFNGHAFYRAWWEILPAPETPIGMKIRPGDAMTVSIIRGVPDWTITITDTTTSQSYSTMQSYSGPRTSAEWIQEAPTIGRHVATLAPDSTVIFDAGTVNGANPGFVNSEAGAMFKGRRHQISTPSVPDSDRDGFAVAYGSLGPPAPSS